MLVLRGTSVRKANVCQLPDPRNSQSFRPTVSRKLAYVLQSSPTGNEPIFWYRRAGLKPECGYFAKIQPKANSQYAIKKTGLNSGSGHDDHQDAPTAIPFLRSPDPLQKIKQRTHFSSRGRPARVRGAARQNTAKSQFAIRSSGQPAYERSREGPWRRRFRATRPSRLILTLMADQGVRPTRLE
jgi:hypothetical protein